MKSIAMSLLALSVALALPSALAQQDHAQHHPQSDTAAVTDDMTAAVVRKLDVEYGKITLKHEPIASLGMPAMTMVFQIQDKALFDGLAPGDSVRVKVEKVGSALVVTAIEKIPHL
ncbi:hypothetical protein WG68_14015 [Arsukibacterium ikkense]|uniref:RND transporter n=1 Tax=Arsukibacterium ikkense TaxID=336831 RepID=A0A0M2V4V7_9GAMM|nr:copper-binding protein [Arsukibacterium ikkense]KKO44665.1 hypothetical protein WG68_14015 [Arsukibacterium ikkense]